MCKDDKCCQVIHILKNDKIVKKKYNLFKFSRLKTKRNLFYTECPTRYRTRHFFNNSNTNEDIVTKFEREYVLFFHISYKMRLSPLQISLQYLHWC